jgi:hypothetical protein
MGAAKALAKALSLTTIMLISFPAFSEEEKKEEPKKAVSEPVERERDWIHGFARKSEKESPVPKDLIKKIESDYHASVKDPVLEAKPVVRHLMIVRAELTQEKPRALKGQVRIVTPPGGGTVELEDFVTPLKGAFDLKIFMENEHHEIQEISKVYFVSASKKRVLENETFGSGCGKYFDITSFFKNKMLEKGFDLYTANQRYVSVLRGTFVFVTYLPEALQLASLTFLDSRYKSWDCPGL